MEEDKQLLENPLSSSLHRIVFVPEECLVSSEDSSEGSTTDRDSPSESLKLSDIHDDAGQEEFS